MNCKNCGKEVPPGSRFCPHCGAQLRQTAPVSESDCHVAPSPVQPAPSKADLESDGKKHCIKCGEEIPDDSVLCPYCGAWQQQPDRGNNDAMQKKTIDSRAFIAMGAVVVLLIAALIIVSSLIASGKDKDGTPEPLPETTGSTESSAELQPVSNGQYFVMPDYELMCPLDITVGGERSYYIYLEYIGEPEDSYDSRQPGVPSPVEEDISFYIESGNSAELYVPVGEYRAYYASGYDWQGTDALFGGDTVYNKDEYILVFYTDEDSAYGYTLELWDDTENNPDMEPIAPEDFPS